MIEGPFADAQPARTLTRIRARFAPLRFALWRNEGQALVEFALLSPLVLLVVLGMCVFGLMLNQYLSLTNATALAAQQLAVSSEPTDPCATVYTAVTNAAPNLIAANLSFTINVNGTNYVSGASGSSKVSCTSEASSFDNATNEPLTITVTYPFTASFIGFTSQSYTMSATVEEVIE